MVSGVPTLSDSGTPCFVTLGPGVLSRTIPSGLNDTVDVGTFGLAGGLANLDISMVGDTTSISNVQVSKTYKLGSFYAATSGGWQILSPLSKSVRDPADDIELEANISGGSIALRVRRSAAANPGGGTISLNIQRSGSGSDTFTPSTATASAVTPPTTYYSGSTLPISSFNGGSGASSSTFWRGDGTWAAAGGGALPGTTHLLKGDGVGSATDTKVTLTAPATAWTITPGADNQTTTIPGGTLLANTRRISTAAPLTGGGDLSTDQTISCPTCITTVTGTANQITSTGGASPVLGLPSSLVLPGSLTVGTTAFLDSANYATFALACAAATTANAELLVSKSWTGLSTQTCSAPAIRFLPSGRLQPASGQTVTLSGFISAGFYQIFDISLGGTVVGFKATTANRPEWWGAAADNTHDDTAALKAAIAAGGEVELSVGTYKLTSLVDLAGVPGTRVANRRMFGHGQASILNFKGTMAAGLRLMNAANATIENFQINADPTVTYALDFEADTSGPYIYASNLYVTGGVNAVALGATTHGDLALVTLMGVTGSSATNAGFLLGDGIGGNVLELRCFGCVATNNTYGVYMNAAVFSLWSGGTVQHNSSADFNLAGAPVNPIAIDGVRSESSGRFWQGPANTFGAASIALRNLNVSTFSATDNCAINHPGAIPMLIENSVFQNTSASARICANGTPTHPLYLTLNNVTSNNQILGDFLPYPSESVRVVQVNSAITNSVNSLIPGATNTSYGLRSTLGGSESVRDFHTLGSNLFKDGNGTFGNVYWGTTGDFTPGSPTFTYTHSSGSGTLTETVAHMYSAPLSNRWYQLSYSITAASGTPPSCSVTTSISSAAVPISLSVSSHYVDLLSATSPSDFVLSCTSSAAGSFTMNGLTIEEFQGGNVYTGGAVYSASVVHRPTAFAELPACSSTPSATQAGLGTLIFCKDCKNLTDDTTGTWDSVATGSGHGTNVLCVNNQWRVR
ncbi:MAG TPA: hypothetical protein VGH38_19240 [Bryobacteraceae bacterium]|jgi:hypothetical protein